MLVVRVELKVLVFVAVVLTVAVSQGCASSLSENSSHQSLASLSSSSLLRKARFQRQAGPTEPDVPAVREKVALEDEKC